MSDHASGEQPPPQQYPAQGQPAPQYGQPAPQYGQPPQQYPAQGQPPFATGPPAETNASALVLTIVSGIIMLSTCFLIGLPSLIFGIMALTSNRTDPVDAPRKARMGWIFLAGNAGIVVLLAVAAVAMFALTGMSAFRVTSHF